MSVIFPLHSLFGFSAVHCGSSRGTTSAEFKILEQFVTGVSYGPCVKRVTVMYVN